MDRTRHQSTRRVSTPADLLALVPGLMGFHPEDSVVVVTVGAARHPFHARVDLPDDPVGVEDLAGHLAEVAGRHGLTQVAAVVYSSDAGLAEALGEALADRLAAVGVELVVLVRADGTCWWTLHARPAGGPAGGLAGGPAGGPAGEADAPGTPYDVSTHPLTARAVVEGTVVLGSRRELAESLVGTDPEEAETVAVLADAVAARLAPRDGARGPGLRERLALEGRWVRHRVRRFLRDGHRLDTHDVARLATLVAVSTEVRDVAWAELTHDNAARHVDLWRDVVRRVPVDVRAAPASLLALAAWVSGSGALAWCAVDVAQQADPDYRLAGLISQALTAAVPPSTWQPFPREALTLFAG
jgi:hypothetical protein